MSKERKKKSRIRYRKNLKGTQNFTDSSSKIKLSLHYYKKKMKIKRKTSATKGRPLNQKRLINKSYRKRGNLLRM